MIGRASRSIPLGHPTVPTGEQIALMRELSNTPAAWTGVLFAGREHTGAQGERTIPGRLDPHFLVAWGDVMRAGRMDDPVTGGGPGPATT